MTSRPVRIILGLALVPVLAGAVSAAPALAAKSKSGAWATTGSMNAGRMAATVTALPNGQLLAAGRADQHRTPLATAGPHHPPTGTGALTRRMRPAPPYPAPPPLPHAPPHHPIP